MSGLNSKIDLNREESVRSGFLETGLTGECTECDGGAVLSIRSEYGAVFGLGERFDRVNQKGAHVRAEVTEKFCNQGTVSYLPVPFFFTDAGFGVFVNTETVTEYEFEDSFIRIIVGRGSGGRLPEVYLLTGSPAEILKYFSGLTGKPGLVPKWSLGIWMSANRWHTQEEVIGQAERAGELGFPANVLVIEAWSDEATFYRFNEHGEWPDPGAMISDLREKGIHTVLWQIPVFKRMDHGESHPVLDEDRRYAADHRLCIRNLDGTPYTIPDGHWFAGSMLPDFSNPETKEWWFGKRKYLLDLGVDGFKTDGGEFILTDAVKGFDGRTGLELRNGYAADYVKAYSEFIGPDKVLFSRAGFTGQQKFPMQWAGDQASDWDELRHVLSAGLSAGLSGIVFWGFDIAGFAGALPDPELYERATQAAVFAPVMQWHSEPAGGQFAEIMPSAGGINDRSPWNMAQVYQDDGLLSRLKHLHNLRMNLIPYLYDQAVKASETGLPMMRHLILDYPEDEPVRDVQDCFLLGDLLVCPVVRQGEEEREVYLPSGGWTLISDLLFGQEQGETKSRYYAAYEGGRGCVCRVKAGIDRIPVFIRDGGAVALNLPKDGGPGDSVGNRMDGYEGLVFYLAGEKGRYFFADDLGNKIEVRWNGDSVQAFHREGTAEFDIRRLWADGSKDG